MRSTDMNDERVLLTHGGGGRMARRLIESIVSTFDNPTLARMEDASPVDFGMSGAIPGKVVMTTDSFVVTPLFFPGGDIGKLSVCGTVNDLATAGAVPAALSVGLIIEEGFAVRELKRVLESMKKTADSVPVPLITGDTKVVEKGRGDGLYISTAGVGIVRPGVDMSPARIAEGDAVLISGPVGTHEASILSARKDLSLGARIESDCAPLSGLMQRVLDAVPDAKCARDPTRGGVAAVLCELAESACCTISLVEEAIPVEEPVLGLCDILGLDPLQMANEGKMIVIVPDHRTGACLEAMRSLDIGKNSGKIGEVRKGPGRLVLKTPYGTSRIITMPAGNQLPRIC
jgi:hydrogenase expression/formation protein HypE